ncbi:MAG: hypothetical protein MUO68_00635 [Desulfobacteraceae bacterium]|nr:hypothetical protein [Desulfobacteraceae bacterium]
MNITLNRKPLNVDDHPSGERIINLERLFLIRAGFGSKDDSLPKRFTREPLPDGPAKGHVRVGLEDNIYFKKGHPLTDESRVDPFTARSKKASSYHLT